MQQPRRRSRIILGVLALGLLAGAALTASPAQAVDALGPYYAEPAWDRKLPADTRFVVLTNWGNSEAVLDKETGLVWERAPAIQATEVWNEARLECANRTTGTRKGWRLPSVHELASLVHPSGFIPGGPILVPGHPFVGVAGGNQLSALYWSATTSAAVSSARAWTVFFGTGNVAHEFKEGTFQAWCVRGGNNADAY